MKRKYIYKVDMTNFVKPSAQGIGKAEVGDFVLYHHSQLFGQRKGTVVWKSQTDEGVDHVEYQVDTYPVLLWEGQVDKVITKRN